MDGSGLAITDLTSPPTWRTPPAPATLEKHASFADALGRAVERPGDTPEQEARRAAEQLVAGAFVRPILEKVREATMAAPPFQPTQGERQFRAIADAQVAQAIVHGARFPLVDRITESLLRRGSAAGEPARAVEAIG